jgi:phosphoribosylglycinamide formyltransferase-1
MTRFAVMASGRGSNFEAILGALDRGDLKAELTSLVCDRAGAPVIAKAEKAGVRVHSILPDSSLKGTERRREHEGRILEALGPENAEWLVLAGYMRVITPTLVEAFRSTEQGHTKIVNIHPSLLPAFDGLDSYRRAFEHGCQVTGVSVHLVEEEVDGGPICAQEAFSLADLKSADAVEERGLEVEHRVFPQTLSWLFGKQYEIQTLNGGRKRLVRTGAAT